MVNKKGPYHETGQPAGWHAVEDFFFFGMMALQLLIISRALIRAGMPESGSLLIAFLLIPASLVFQSLWEWLAAARNKPNSLRFNFLLRNLGCGLLAWLTLAAPPGITGTLVIALTAHGMIAASEAGLADFVSRRLVRRDLGFRRVADLTALGGGPLILGIVFLLAENAAVPPWVLTGAGVLLAILLYRYGSRAAFSLLLFSDDKREGAFFRLAS